MDQETVKISTKRDNPENWGYESVDYFHKFTDKERLKIADTITSLDKEIDDLNSHLESLKSQVKSTKELIDGKDEERKDYSRKYKHGGRMLTDRCKAYYNWEDDIVELYHPDTGEIFDTLPIPSDRRQLRIHENNNED